MSKAEIKFGVYVTAKGVVVQKTAAQAEKDGLRSIRELKAADLKRIAESHSMDPDLDGAALHAAILEARGYDAEGRVLPPKQRGVLTAAQKAEVSSLVEAKVSAALQRHEANAHKT